MNIEELRNNLLEELLSASFNGNPNAMGDYIAIKNGSDEDVLEYAVMFGLISSNTANKYRGL